MDKFVRKRKPTNPTHEDESSNNESEGSDLLISSDADFMTLVYCRLRYLSLRKTLALAVAKQLYNMKTMLRGNVEELFKKAGNKSLTGYSTRMKNRERFVAHAKPRGAKTCHYLLHRNRCLQASVLLRMVLETGKRR